MQSSQKVTASSFFDLQLGLLHIFGLLYGPVPAIDDIFRHDAADLAYLKRDASDLGQIILVAELFHFLDNVKYRSELMHGAFPPM